MTYQSEKVSDIKIAYIGGGSRGWAWTFMTDLALEPAISGQIRLYDIDREAAEDNVIIGNKVSSMDAAVGKWQYIVSDTLREAVLGADFVVISILPGTFDEMEADVHMPERFGVYQSVGDTAGPGGMMRALRTIPMFEVIAKAIKEYARDAWVINYTNPMSLCIKALYEVFPEIKAFGCCHEVFGTQKVLANMVKEETGNTEVSRSDIDINVLGINHFTWFDYASYRGMDLMPLYRSFVERHYKEGFDEPDTNWANACFACAHRVKFDLFKRYGLIAAAGDRHLAEFMPGREYLRDPETVHSWKFELTPVSWRKQDLKNRLARSRAIKEGRETLELKPTGEEGIKLIKALLGLTRLISNVNIPNSALQISNLPAAAVVETNAVFERDKIRPIIAGALPKDILKLVKPHITNHELIMKAAFSCNRELVYKAFMNDPLMGKRAGEADVKYLVDDMLMATKKYLPQGWF